MAFLVVNAHIYDWRFCVWRLAQRFLQKKPLANELANKIHTALVLSISLGLLSLVFVVLQKVQISRDFSFLETDLKPARRECWSQMLKATDLCSQCDTQPEKTSFNLNCQLSEDCYWDCFTRCACFQVLPLLFRCPVVAVVHSNLWILRRKNDNISE